MASVFDRKNENTGGPGSAKKTKKKKMARQNHLQISTYLALENASRGNSKQKKFAMVKAGRNGLFQKRGGKISGAVLVTPMSFIRFCAGVVFFCFVCFVLFLESLPNFFCEPLRLLFFHRSVLRPATGGKEGWWGMESGLVEGDFRIWKTQFPGPSSSTSYWTIPDLRVDFPGRLYLYFIIFFIGF